MAADKPLLEPLSLSGINEKSDPKKDAISSIVDDDVQCIFCKECFKLDENQDSFLKHLILVHKFVIADVKLIACLKSYVAYWRRRFSESTITDFCSVIQTNSKTTDPEPSEFYYLLCDALPEDKQIRVDLQKQKLDSVLKQQHLEREDQSFSRNCLFCRQHFTSNRSELFNHMAFEHSFSVGQPDNLVYTSEFLDILEEKLSNLKCLYCEKIFKDRHVLKEHMRKKQHKKLNSKNTKYDKFYIINYLEPGRNWESLQAENDREDTDVNPTEESDASSPANEWDDWLDEGGSHAVCLYCDWTSQSCTAVVQHMKDIHQFDMNEMKTELNLSFYQQVKLINYIRRQVHQKICPVCQESFETRDALLDHMNFLGHVSRLPEVSVWDQPQYYFPTYENDALLCMLEENEDSVIGRDTGKAVKEENVVIAEDCPVKESILVERGVRDMLLT